MVCLSVCACHSVLMGFNDSEKGSDAGACLRKMLKGGVLPPRSSGSYSRDEAFSSHLILLPFVWISDEISYITDLGSFLQVHQSSSHLLLMRSRCLGVQPFQGYHATDDHHQHLTPRRPESAYRQREGGGKGKNAAVGKNMLVEGRGLEPREAKKDWLWERY